jgi:hypothetical protein
MAEKLKKAKDDPQIKYQWTPNDGDRCSKCTMYRAPRGECTDVAGDISPMGWCRIYQARKR